MAIETDHLIIDLSAGVGEVNWEVLAPQIQGALIRATSGKEFDSRFFENYEGAAKYDVPTGVYGWHNPSDSGLNNKTQAAKLVEAIKTIQDKPKLGVYGDWETDYKVLTIAQMREAIWKYIYVVEDGTGDPLDAYTSAGFWNEQVANSYNGYTDIPRGRLLWVANWRYTPPPWIPADWSHRYSTNCWNFWQYSNRLLLPGVNAYLDANMFNGTYQDFVDTYDLDVVIPEPPPPPPDPEPIPPAPEMVKIIGLDGGTLRVRKTVWGDLVSYTWDGVQFPVKAVAKDSAGREWFRIKNAEGGLPEHWIAGWYTEEI